MARETFFRAAALGLFVKVPEKLTTFQITPVQLVGYCEAMGDQWTYDSAVAYYWLARHLPTTRQKYVLGMTPWFYFGLKRSNFDYDRVNKSLQFKRFFKEMYDSGTFTAFHTLPHEQELKVHKEVLAGCWDERFEKPWDRYIKK